MLPSVFALAVPRKAQQPARHNITCGLLDILACKHCRRARKSLIPSCCKTPSDKSTKDKAQADIDRGHGKGDKKAMKNKDKYAKNNNGKNSHYKEKLKVSAVDTGKGVYPHTIAQRDLESLTLRPSSLLLSSRRHSLSTSNLPDAVTIGAYSILKTSPLCQERKRMVSDNLKKQAHFSESVSVIVHDLNTDQVIKDEIRLKEPTIGDEECRKSKGILDPRRINEKPFELDSMDVEYASGKAFVKVKIFVGAEFLNEKVEIHTAKQGQCLVIVAYKPEPLGDGTNYFRRYMQKFRLIGAVDPYTIEASILPKGFVKIRAPLLNWDDQDEHDK